MSLQYRREGAFLTLHLRPRKLPGAGILGTEIFPPMDVVLRLTWAECAVLIFLVATGFLITTFRQTIAQTELIDKIAPQHLQASALIIALLSIWAGLSLAVWKKKQLLMYSLAEILFGSSTAFEVALGLWPNGELTKFVALGSSLYVVSRGF